MSGTSKKTVIVSFRVPNAVYAKIKKRSHQQARYKTVSSYLRDRTTYDVERKHGTRKKK